jgi:hypothetical protein
MTEWTGTAFELMPLGWSKPIPKHDSEIAITYIGTTGEGKRTQGQNITTQA